MEELLNSHLYKLLRYWQRFDNGFESVNEIYFFMYGYDSFMNQGNLSQEIHEEWISKFYSYISEELKNLFFPSEEIRSVHFGIIINEYAEDKKAGVELFYKILDEFVKSQEVTQSNECKM